MARRRAVPVTTWSSTRTNSVEALKNLVHALRPPRQLLWPWPWSETTEGRHHHLGWASKTRAGSRRCWMANLAASLADRSRFSDASRRVLRATGDGEWAVLG
jgi:hypothetical protein